MQKEAKRVVITGATGMIGGIVLKECLNSNEIGSVVSFVRKPGELSHPKLQELVISDFTDYSNHEQYFRNVDAVYFCIGVYTGAVSKEKFKEITVDYTISFARMIEQNSPNARFCFLSGAGSDRSEKSRMIFAKTKGMAENYLLSNLKHVHSFRPAYIYPVEKRKEPNFSYRLSRSLYPLIKLFGDNASVSSVDLARAMFVVGLQGHEKEILENRDIVGIEQR